ncbi:TPA: hypothetical protein N5O20_000380 [Enterobacter kobei]|jgi:hypothetical protein|uniref:Uncharacterized protein n=1 Tax=Enterobacter kobei TaxID=208224 RepID=A0AAJ6LLP6_9ENTR|nr:MULTISPECIES: hypothetical protein [Enterobacter]AIX56492.1 hypothetical protein ECNIH4_20505 [Enterobacter cloacae]EAO9317108.1 hypothetical protein [Salmonella enterica]AMZ75569.1 hypothetical protein A4308_00515 [Enterobacter sp. ODB01]AOP85202.1 hypothetical protein BFV64_02015 [Enterobacter kobei]EAU0090932.1 hypothetical protein [Salmonella enterica]
MSKKSHILSLFILIIAAFIFGRSTYVEYLAWYYGSDNLVFNEVNIALLSSLFNGLYFALSASIIYASLMLLKRIPKNIVASCLLQFCINIGLYTLFVAVERGYSKLHTLGSGATDITHSYFLGALLTSTLLTVAIVSVIHAKFLSSKHKDGLHKGV